VGTRQTVVRSLSPASATTRETFWQLVRFAVTGGAMTAFYAAVYWPLATYVMNPNLAVVIAFLAATVIGRFAHGAVSFRGYGTRTARTARRFFLVQLFGFVLQQLFTWVLVTGPFFHGPTWWPLVPAVSVVPLLTFWLQRNWVFR
jgi:putative flippase GtrA